ncbi:4'-phosphopantetheinyl transferase superfamily protein [Hymenobacter sp. M29]|uniref:4'-phosphopantetheinyl transferase superfamily protein n=1 Tax=Hymenobacter mellowenesis TaxID=3063995 RepID=A0ABT9AAU4_9BACT|nr:4'-phosphopantetheinyl transferase superfamily protein [Hymenobacter sp. M29]MDO7846955.1 4'-phosphopantetheinyl transferase superfamily protein [Hymenobacter sp. M29]
MPLYSLQHLSPTAVLGLWHLTETPAELWPLLPQPEAYQALLPAKTDARRQAQWLGGRVLLHRLLSETLPDLAAEILVQNDNTGRPWLAGAGPGPTVSLSHSGTWVAAILAQDGRAGVDVEEIRDKAHRLASKFLAADEWAAAQAASQAGLNDASTHYSLLWSAKETLYKLSAQRGIIFKTQLLLGEFEPRESGEIPATLVLNGLQTRHCICYSQPAPGYVLTYCHEPHA